MGTIKQHKMKCVQFAVLVVLLSSASAIPVSSVPQGEKEGEDKFVATPDMQSKMVAHAFEASAPEKVSEEDKMNDAAGDAPLTADEERAQALATLISGEDRMNTEGSDDAELPAPIATKRTQALMATETARDMNGGAVSGAGNTGEDDRDLATSMDTASDAGVPTAHTRLTMAATSAFVRGDEPSAFDTMNALKSGKVGRGEPEQQVKVATSPPSSVLTTPSLPTTAVVPSSVLMHSALRTKQQHDQQDDDDEMMTMTKKATTTAPTRPHPTISTEQPPKSSTPTISQPASRLNRAILQTPTTTTTTTTTTAKNNNSNNNLWEAKNSDTVLEQAATMNNGPEATMDNGPAGDEEEYAIAPPPSTTSTATRDADVMGEAMMDVMPNSHLALRTANAEKGGFMDASGSDSKFINEMNTVVRGLNMMRAL